MILDSKFSKMTPKFVNQKSHRLHSSRKFANPGKEGRMVEGGRRKRRKQKRTDEWRKGGRRDRKKEGRPTVHSMILVNQDEVTIKKQINNMKIEWRWCLSIADEGGEGGGGWQ